MFVKYRAQPHNITFIGITSLYTVLLYLLKYPWALIVSKETTFGFQMLYSYIRMFIKATSVSIPNGSIARLCLISSRECKS